ncbi:MAG: phospholipase D-like domain-containing protein [Sphingobacteriaceae bacterium]
MKISFLGQGFEGKSVDAVGNHLMNFLSQKGFDSFTGISAFASETGVYGLAHYLNTARSNFKNLNLIVGVDLEGTSKEALEEILAANINSYIFYQKEQPVFHPKIYLFEGAKEFKLIIGSTNLTRGGLFTNVESSLLIEFNSTDKKGLTLLTEFKAYYKSLFNFSDPNLFKISSAVINDFYTDGIIPDETTRRNNFHKKAITASSQANTVTKKANIQTRTTAKVPHSFPTKPRKSGSIPTATSQMTAVQVAIVQPILNQPQPRLLVWQKFSLSQSDAQFVPTGTNGTGNLKLSQARFRLNGLLINHNTYFRNQVFQHLIWARTKPTSATYEETIGNFDITILGTPHGVQSIKLSYDPIRISNQANTPSWLHWGNVLMSILQQTNVTGRTLNLYQLGNQSFSIEVV